MKKPRKKLSKSLKCRPSSSILDVEKEKADKFKSNEIKLKPLIKNRKDKYK